MKNWMNAWFRKMFFCKRRTHYWAVTQAPWGKVFYVCEWCDKVLTIKQYRSKEIDASSAQCPPMQKGEE